MLVYDAYLRSEVIVVNVLAKMASGVAWGSSVSRRVSCGRLGKGSITQSAYYEDGRLV
jgi:hypothetical protein